MLAQPWPSPGGSGTIATSPTFGAPGAAQRQSKDMPQILIIGGAGRMGRRFGQWLAAAGHTLTSLDRDNAAQAEALLARADLVLVSVPIDTTETVIRDIGPRLRPDAVLADLTSLKVGPMAAMLAAHPGPVVGLHPMFGPSVTRLAGQKIVVCAGRQAEAAQWLLDDFARAGAELVAASPEEHDRMMSVVQAIRHFVTFALGSYLAAEDIDIARSLDFSSPVYRLEVDMVSRLFAQDGALYADIMLASPERRAAIGRLAEHYAELARLIRDGDREALLARFQTTARSFAGEAERAMTESAVVIDALAEHLAKSR